MTAEKSKLLDKYKLHPPNKNNSTKRRGPSMTDEQWNKMINLSVWKGHLLIPTQPKLISGIGNGNCSPAEAPKYLHP